MKYMKAFISVTGVLLLVMLGIGFALPGDWSATRTIRIDAERTGVWPLIADLRRWNSWAPLGEVEAEFSEPSRGPGATREWDDAAWGQGVVTIRSATPPMELVYEVAVEGGALRTIGTLQLESAGPETTTVTWTEEGDFGWNPLLSWFALGMEKRQGAQLDVGLRRLKQRVEEAS